LVLEGFYRLYSQDGGVRQWHGRRVVGVDGSVFNVPDTAETRQCYSLQTNQHAAGGRVQALGSVCYDLLNHVALSAGLGKKQAEKHFIFTRHLSATAVGDVVVLDRGYTDYGVMAFLQAHRREFVIRLSRHSFGVVEPFWTSPLQEQVVTLQLPRAQRRFVAAQGLASTLRGRLVKVELPNGQLEVLATSLLDAAEYPHAELKTVYGWRWGVGVSREGSLTQSVQVRPRLTDSGLVAREAPGRESKPVKPSDTTLGKESAQRSRLQRTVNADVASSHATPVAEPVYYVRRQQGPSEKSLPRRSSPAGSQRRHGAKGERATGEVRGVRRRKLAAEAWPITVRGKWLGWHPDGGSGCSTGDLRAAKRAGREGPGPVGIPSGKGRQG